MLLIGTGWTNTGCSGKILRLPLVLCPTVDSFTVNPWGLLFQSLRPLVLALEGAVTGPQQTLINSLINPLQVWLIDIANFHTGS